MGTLNVNIESVQEKLAYRIYTIGGRIIGDGHLFKGANKLSCDSLSSGLYILDVVDTSSKERAIKKFIKH